MAIQLSAAMRNDRLDAIQYGPSNGAGSTVTAWAPSTSYTAKTSWVTNGGNLYLCTTSGTSAGSGGPTTTSSDITDNTAHWTYIGPMAIEASPTLKLFTGSMPANCATADSGTLLATMSLPAGWMAAASAGAKAKAGTWSVAAGAAGTIGYFRIYDSAGTCHIQGTCGIGTGDMQFDNTAVTSTQVVTITGFTLTDANA